MADLRSLLWAFRDACHPCTGAQGAILLLDVRRGRSAGHRSDRGARGTGWDMVAPAESARPASLTSRLAAECAGGYRVGIVRSVSPLHFQKSPPGLASLGHPPLRGGIAPHEVMEC